MPATDVARPPETAGPIERHASAPNGGGGVGFALGVGIGFTDAAGAGVEADGLALGCGDAVGVGAAFPAAAHSEKAIANAVANGP